MNTWIGIVGESPTCSTASACCGSWPPLTGAVLSGLGVAAGVTLPMILKGSGIFSEAPDLTSHAGLVILAGVVAMTRTMTLGFARAQRSVKLRLSKCIGTAMNPLRYERDVTRLLAGVEYAGYTQRTRVKLLGAAARSPLPVGIWNLIQLPHGGEMMIPIVAMRSMQ